MSIREYEQFSFMFSVSSLELLVGLLENLERLLLLWLLDWRWLQWQVLIIVVVVMHVLLLGVLLLDTNDLLDGSVIRLLL